MSQGKKESQNVINALSEWKMLNGQLIEKQKRQAELRGREEAEARKKAEAQAQAQVEALSVFKNKSPQETFGPYNIRKLVIDKNEMTEGTITQNMKRYITDERPYIESITWYKIIKKLTFSYNKVTRSQNNVLTIIADAIKNPFNSIAGGIKQNQIAINGAYIQVVIVLQILIYIVEAFEPEGLNNIKPSSYYTFREKYLKTFVNMDKIRRFVLYFVFASIDKNKREESSLIGIKDIVKGTVKDRVNTLLQEGSITRKLLQFYVLPQGSKLKNKVVSVEDFKSDLLLYIDYIFSLNVNAVNKSSFTFKNENSSKVSASDITPNEFTELQKAIQEKQNINTNIKTRFNNTHLASTPN